MMSMVRFNEVLLLTGSGVILNSITFNDSFIILPTNA